MGQQVRSLQVQAVISRRVCRASFSRTGSSSSRRKDVRPADHRAYRPEEIRLPVEHDGDPFAQYAITFQQQYPDLSHGTRGSFPPSFRSLSYFSAPAASPLMNVLRITRKRSNGGRLNSTAAADI
jgi:hypothetical protein